MGKQTSHVHPNKVLYQLQQISIAILFAITIIAAILLSVVAVMLSLPLVIMMSIVLLLLSFPLLMSIVNTPPIIISEDGLTLTPLIGAERLVTWDGIQRIDIYPLLPQPNQETLKQYLVGRNKYQAAEGIMLIIPTLPFPYRIAGFLAAAKGQPIIALTNRTHSDYTILKQRISRYASHAIQDPLIIEE